MITLICGYPRAGKTTYSQTYNNVIHLDDFGIDPYSGVENYVKHARGDIVIDGVYQRKNTRMKLLHYYTGDGKRTCIWIDTPKEIRQIRTKRKVCDFPFDPPSYDEGWDEIIVIRGQ